MSEGTIDWVEMRRRIAAVQEGLERGFEPGEAEVRARLRERARLLARKPDAPEAEGESVTVLEFTLQGRTFAVESRHVREVTVDAQPTPVPCTPGFMAGIFYLRGQIVSAIDFGQLCGLPASPDAATIIVLQAGDRMLGLAVDGVIGLTGLYRDQLDPVPATVQGGRRFFHGISRTGTILLDGAVLFNDDENGFAQAGLAGTATRGH